MKNHENFIKTFQNKRVKLLLSQSPGCILFNATSPMTWTEAQRFCGSAESYNSHLVEIFNQEQQDYLTMKAHEAELLTGSESNWWIGRYAK